jgi:N utilization substance protein B
MTKRRQARELVLKGLYAYEICPRDIDEIFNELAPESNLGPEPLRFARQYMENVISHGAFLDGEIARLAENWEIERIALIDKIILRMALCEIHFMPDIPEKVSINEAIDLAKEYSTLESSAFVNGILDAAISGSTTRKREEFP